MHRWNEVEACFKQGVGLETSRSLTICPGEDHLRVRLFPAEKVILKLRCKMVRNPAACAKMEATAHLLTTDFSN
jgi:hypothetical protein